MVTCTLIRCYLKSILGTQPERQGNPVPNLDASIFDNIGYRRMKRKKVWRYYCDYCGKGGCGAGAMAKHERRCTKNPKRECGFHIGFCFISEPSVPLDALKVIIRNSKVYEVHVNPVDDMISVDMVDDEALRDSLLDAANGCPACVLAAIRQSGINLISFNYKEEVDRVFAEWHEQENRYVEYDAIYG